MSAHIAQLQEIYPAPRRATALFRRYSTALSSLAGILRTIVATASRPETTQWCLDLGAHAVIDHNEPMPAQLEKLKLPPASLSNVAPDKNWRLP